MSGWRVCIVRQSDCVKWSDPVEQAIVSGAGCLSETVHVSGGRARASCHLCSSTTGNELLRSLNMHGEL